MLSFLEVEVSDAKLILEWRTNPRVASLMATVFDSDVQSQENWINQCRERSDYYHWIVCSDSKKIGLVSIAQLDLEKGSTHWGFYIGEDGAVGKGGLIPAYLYNFLFSQQDIQTLHTESFESNVSVLALHELYGYVYVPENNRVVEKQGESHTLKAMDLSKDVWLKQTRFSRYQARFPLTKWSGNPGLVDFIDDPN